MKLSTTLQRMKTTEKKAERAPDPWAMGCMSAPQLNPSYHSYLDNITSAGWYWLSVVRGLKRRESQFQNLHRWPMTLSVTHGLQ
jgi:hypothetical protein